MESRGSEARRLLRSFRAGVLATHSLKVDGYPYGAAVPSCTDQQGRIILLISHLAEHTQNIERDPRVSFTVSSMELDLQSHARLTVLGDARATDDAATTTRYLRIFPDAHNHLAIGGFRFFALEPRQVRLIAGFGSLHWIAGESMLAPVLAIGQSEADILDHMNTDHAHNLLAYCRHVHGIQAKNAHMAGIDCDGFDVWADGDLLRFDFDSLVESADQARAQLVKLAQAARP